ncbi:MAG: hypothetical protein K6C98_05775 [Treponema sp.]|nr:hypothetical protein [Treponema sp.]
MKKSIKNIAVAMILGTASTMAFAQPHDSGALDSGFRKGAAYTVEDDVYTLMNVNEWQKLQFTNMFGYIDVEGTGDSGNFAVATHLKNKDVLGLRWNGNTWSDESNNTFTGFYGWTNKALKFYITEQTADVDATGKFSDMAFGSAADYKNFGLGALFGMNVNQKIAFNAGLGLDFASANATQTVVAGPYSASVDVDLNATTFKLNGAFIYTFKEAKDLTVKGYAFYNGAYSTIKASADSYDAKYSTGATDFGVGVKAQYKPTSLFTYGFYLECPWSVGVTTPDEGDSVTSSSWDLEMGNGLSFTLKPEKFYMNIGLLTEFPSIEKNEDDTTFGDFRNSYCGGLTFLVTPEIRIDLSALITPEDGISFKDVWEQNFSISLRAKF